MFEAGKEGQTLWDQRIAFHQRLHQAIITASRDMYNEDYQGWYKSLVVLKISLNPHMTVDERTTIDKELNKCRLLSRNTKNKNIKPFVDCQESLHQIMRQKSFDVPIIERSEEGILASMNQ